MSCALPYTGKHATKVNIIFGTAKGKDKKNGGADKIDKRGWDGNTKGVGRKSQGCEPKFIPLFLSQSDNKAIIVLCVPYALRIHHVCVAYSCSIACVFAFYSFL